MKKKTSEMGRLSLSEFSKAEKNPTIIILEDIRSQHNIGSVFRTADAFRISKIYLCGITATPPNKEIQKTALGATESVSWQYSEKTEDVINELKKDGYIIVGVEQTHNSLDLISDNCFSSEEKIALIFGNEVFGVSESTLSSCDKIVEIPQYGTKHSLNISVCAGILIWELFKKQN